MSFKAGAWTSHTSEQHRILQDAAAVEHDMSHAGLWLATDPDHATFITVADEVDGERFCLEMILKQMQASLCQSCAESSRGPVCASSTGEAEDKEPWDQCLFRNCIFFFSFFNHLYFGGLLGTYQNEFVVFWDKGTLQSNQ
jgi:hypothetical protein